MGLLGIIDSLQSSIRKLRWEPVGTEWADYYQETNYSEESQAEKKRSVTRYLESLSPDCVWDLGANVGLYSRIASEQGIQTISFDIDPAGVERNYRKCVASGDKNLLPILLDLTNPSSDIGWANQERMSLLKRGPTDTAMALALIHHLAISNNLPFRLIGEYLSRLCRSLIIEFVPKSDSMVQRLLASREDVFDEYHRGAFELAFEKWFEFEDVDEIAGSQRTLYRMRTR